MYNASYHPVSEETLKWLLAGEPKERHAFIKDAVAQATKEKWRNFKIKFQNGDYYDIENGIVKGSRTEYRK